MLAKAPTDARRPGTTSRSDGPLDRIIAVSFEDMPLADALRAIGSAGRVNFIFRNELLPKHTRVSLDTARRSVGQALAIVLRGVDLEVQETAVGDLILTPPRAPDNAQAAKLGHLSALSILGQKVITGSMVTNTMRELPTTITVLSSDELIAQGVRTVDQLFRGAVPGIVAFDQGSDVNAIGTSALQVRGTAGFTALNAPLKTYVDGVEMSDPTFINHIEAKSIDRIEIALGPQASTLYGSGALSGVMQIFTKRGDPRSRHESQLKPRMHAILSSGVLMGQGNAMAPVHDYALHANGGSTRLSYNIGTGYAFDGAHTSVEYSTAASRNRFFTLGTRALAGSEFRKSGLFDFQLTGRLNARHFGASADQFYAKGIATGQLAYNPYRIVPYDRPGDVKDRTLGATLTWTLPQFQQRFIVGQDRQVSDFSAPARYITTDDSLASFDHGVGRKTTAAYHATLSGFFPNRTDIGWTITTGIDAWHYEYSSAYAGPLRDSSYVFPDAPSGGFLAQYATRQHSTGFFGQGQLSVRNKLFLTAGMRFENELRAGNAGVSPYLPRFGVAYLVDDLPGGVTLKFRSAYGRASRLPCPGCRSGTVPLFGVVLPNPRLTPETQTGLEAGIDLFWDRLMVQVTGYQQSAESFILAVRRSAPDITPITYEFRNGGDTRNRGIEVQSTIGIQNFTVRGTYSYTDARLTSTLAGLPGNLQKGDRPLFVAPLTGAFSVGYAVTRWRLSSGFSYVGSYRDFTDDTLTTRVTSTPESGNATPAPTIVDASSQLRVYMGASADLSHRMQLFLRGDNLNNSHGLSVSRNVAGRRIVLGLRVGGE